MKVSLECHIKEKHLDELSQETIDIIKNLSPLIHSKSLEISRSVFEKLFKKYPHLKHMFNNPGKDYNFLFAEALCNFTVNIDNLKVLELALHHIACVHSEAFVMPEHYVIMGPVLMQSIGEVFGDKITIKELDAFRDGYKYIASLLIEMERKIYLEMIQNSNSESLCIPMTIRK